MATLAHGRIVIWEGGSLWIFEGDQAFVKTDPHAHHAIQITIAVEGDFQIEVAGEVVSGPVAAVAADTSHIFGASGMAALLFIEPESTPGRALAAKWFGQTPLKSLHPKPFANLVDDLRRDFRSHGNDEYLTGIGKSLIGEIAGAVDQKPLDTRVVSMIEIASENLDNREAPAMAAAHVNLSNSRARHLFVEQTGMPLKSYVLWRRLSRAVELYAGGASLTEAAHAAGFSDSAHLSRTFRRMFGLSAVSLRVAAQV